jgi:hypothetical protein
MTARGIEQEPMSSIEAVLISASTSPQEDECARRGSGEAIRSLGELSAACQPMDEFTSGWQALFMFCPLSWLIQPCPDKPERDTVHPEPHKVESTFPSRPLPKPADWRCSNHHRRRKDKDVSPQAHSSMHLA